MSPRQVLRQYGLRRRDFPSVYHWRTAKRLALHPSPYPDGYLRDEDCEDLQVILERLKSA
jgi:hypothetical protein